MIANTVSLILKPLGGTWGSKPGSRPGGTSHWLRGTQDAPLAQQGLRQWGAAQQPEDASVAIWAYPENPPPPPNICMHACVHMYAHTRIRVQPCTHTCARTHTPAPTHPPTHPPTHSHVHTQTHTHTHTHIHAQRSNARENDFLNKNSCPCSVTNR